LKINGKKDLNVRFANWVIIIDLPIMIVIATGLLLQKK